MTNKFIQLDDTKQSQSGFEALDLSGGFTCDLETGICGPVSEIQENKKTEENKNANNDMV